MAKQSATVELHYEMALKSYESSRYNVDSIHNALNQLIGFSLLIVVLSPMAGRLGSDSSCASVVALISN